MRDSGISEGKEFVYMIFSSSLGINWTLSSTTADYLRLDGSIDGSGTDSLADWV
jgi:hypothetical protein